MNELEQKLGKGLYVDNLRDLVLLCETLMQQGKHRVQLYVLQSVLFDLLQDWSGRPQTAEEVRTAEEAILDPSLRLVESLRTNQPLEAQVKALDELVESFLSLLAQATGEL